MKYLILTISILIISFVVWLFSTVKASNHGNHYEYKVIRVIDGDTIDIEVSFLPPELGNSLKLRIYGIDTPEKGHQAKCNAERKKAASATQYVQDLLASAKVVKVEFRKWDKFGGRVLGDLIIDNQRLSQLLIDSGHAIPYDGGRKNKNWC